MLNFSPNSRPYISDTYDKMTNVTTETLKQLREPFPSSAIQWRVGSKNQEQTRGKALPYIDARVVQNRLDDIVGPGNWKNRYTEVIVDGKLLAVRCALAVKIGNEWVEKEDGAHLDNIQTFDDAEKAIKGVYSDAEKRAAVQWGIGRYLYEFDAPWVEIEGNRLLSKPQLPNEMLPANEHRAAPAPTAKRVDPPKAEVKSEEKPTPAPAPAPAPAPEVKPEPAVQPKAEVKPTPAPAPAPEVKAEVKPEPAAKPADAAQEVLAPQGTKASNEEDERRARADEMADQAAAKQPAPAAAPAPTPAPAAAPAPAAQPQAQGDDSDDKLPENLSADQRKLVDEMLVKMTKLPPAMLRGYIDGPKGKEKFTDEVRAYLLKQLAKREASA